MTPQPRRKKWSEAEERTMIDKYGDMVCDGTLSKMKTREKKYKPIAVHVNSMHHLRDPVSYPWQWSWKDVSTKVQNMRHQYSLVKQKIKKQDCSEEFDWMEGITHWSNFLRYKEVFGDVNAACNSGQEIDIVQQFGEDGNFVENNNAVMDLEFEYDGEEEEEDIERRSDLRKKRKVWGFVGKQLGELRDMEMRFEQREVERDRQRRELLLVRDVNKKVGMEREGEKEKEKDKQVRRIQEWIQEWQEMERENEGRERRRRDEEREREERLKRRRFEWKKRMDEMLSQHRAEIGQIQARILNEQQNLTSQFLGIVSQWITTTGNPADHTVGATTSHYLSDHTVNGMVPHGDDDDDNQEDHFIVDDG